jgi:hypothetical protein
MKHVNGHMFSVAFIILLQALTCVKSLWADTLIAWDFAGYTGEEATGEAEVAHAFLAKTDSSFLIRRGPGIQDAPNNDRFNANNWTEADLPSAIDQGDYFEWELYPIPGSVLQLTSITLQIERSSTGPSCFILRSSLDGFSEDLGSWEITTSSQNITVDLTSLPVIESRLIFRFYGYGNTYTAGSAGFEGPGKDVIVEGTLNSKVPLPKNLSIPEATDSTLILSWNIPDGELGTDWSGFYLFVRPDSSNTLNPSQLEKQIFRPNPILSLASIHEGSYCAGHIQDSITCSLILSGIAEGRFYYVTAYAYLVEGVDTSWSVQAPEKSLRYYPIVINEILADPATDISGDANGDGTRSASEDEFIELVNTSASDADLSSWILCDSEGIRHVFPHGTVIPAGGIFVVFGGGSPNLPDSDAHIYLATSGTLSLNNSGESVCLRTHDSTLVHQHTWGSEGSQDQSLVRNPALTGPFILHTSLSGTEAFSPGIITNYENSLPVSLGTFTGTASGYTVHLSWVTESETENAGFSITRQYETEEPLLLANFTSHPELKGYGSTTEQHVYHFTDYPVLAGIYTYWLTDHNYSGEETTHFHKRIRIPYGLTPQPYPNPFNTIFHVPLRLPDRQSVSLTVYNLTGQTILEKKQLLNAGNHEITVNMDTYSSGIYFLQIKSKDYHSVHKMIYLK